jgi:leucyl aminopeptidase
MQNIVLEKANEVSSSISVAYLVQKDSNIENLNLSAQEVAFVNSEIEKNNFLISLNRYSHYIFIVVVEKNDKPYISHESIRKSGYSLCQLIQKNKIKAISLADKTCDKSLVLSLTEGLILSNYQFLKYFNDASSRKLTLEKISVISTEVSEAEILKLRNLVNSIFIARDLINEPASYLTSEVLSTEFKKMGAEAGFSVEVLDKNKIASLKMGGILSVNKGSTQEPTFSVLTWKPENAVNKAPVVLIGKGVVYDSGGYSLKPTGDSMDYMKSDMAGAAAVASVVYSAAKNKLPVYVIALVPSTDNRIGPDAYSPGDVITISDGTTVEVMNTDAEGRLILADALVYAKKYNPALVFTVATLTGAAHRAIGTQGIVAMGNAPDKTLHELIKSGYETYERIALFPFWDEYKDQLKSEIADLKNIGGELAGAITAGKFLEHFTDYPYIHLDIAGMAFNKKPDSYRSIGASGIGIRLLYYFLENHLQ